MVKKTEPFLINPLKKRTKSGKRKISALLARIRKSRMKSNPTKLPKRVGKKHRPVLYGAGSSWKRSIFSRSAKAGIKVNPLAGGLMAVSNPFGKKVKKSSGRKSLRRNPFTSIAAVKSTVKQYLPTALAVTGGIGTSLFVPIVAKKFIEGTENSAVKKIGAQIAASLVGGFAVSKISNKANGIVFGISGLGVVAIQLAAKGLEKMFPDLDFNTINAYPEALEAYPEELAGGMADNEDEDEDEGKLEGHGSMGQIENNVLYSQGELEASSVLMGF
jgi:hypothetical protein